MLSQTNQIIISVFTCTYNRIDTLRRTFESLQAQTFKNFEWIVVDNGSTDSTVDRIQPWISEADFPIVFRRRETNTGYQGVYNQGIKLSRGTFFICLDSDDACVPHALETFMNRWKSIPTHDRANFVGVTVNCMDQHGRLVGDNFPTNPMDSNSLEREMRYKVTGEKWGMLRLEVLREYPFPNSEFHIMPSHVWRAIARKYKTRYTNDILRIYYIEEGARKDQLSYHVSEYKAAFGKQLNSLDLLNNDTNWFWYTPFTFLKNAMNYTRNSYLLNNSTTELLGNVTPLLSKLLTIIAIPYGKWWALRIEIKHKSKRSAD